MLAQSLPHWTELSKKPRKYFK